MKTVLFLACVALFCSCNSSKQVSKYDFSNVQSTSLDAQIYNTSPAVIMKDTVIIAGAYSESGLRAIQDDTAAVPAKFDFSNVKSISTDGMQPAPKSSGTAIMKPDPTVQRPDPLKN